MTDLTRETILWRERERYHIPFSIQMPVLYLGSISDLDVVFFCFDVEIDRCWFLFRLSFMMLSIALVALREREGGGGGERERWEGESPLYHNNYRTFSFNTVSILNDSLVAWVCWVRGIKMRLIESAKSRISEVNLESLPGAGGSSDPLLLLLPSSLVSLPLPSLSM